MLSKMLTTEDIKNIFVQKYKDVELHIDNNSNITIEILNAQFIADKDYIIREPNKDYIKRELEWYKSQSLNVYDIPGKVPKIWIDVSDRLGNINSNYGYLIFSKENYNQFKNTIRELKRNKGSRRAIMIYTRPQMHYEYNKDGMSDFICTISNQFFIRDNKLISIYAMRSNDVIFGYNNDVAWAKYVHKLVYDELVQTYPDLEMGELVWNVNSLHIYERHFKYLKNI